MGGLWHRRRRGQTGLQARLFERKAGGKRKEGGEEKKGKKKEKKQEKKEKSVTRICCDPLVNHDVWIAILAMREITLQPRQFILG